MWCSATHEPARRGPRSRWHRGRVEEHACATIVAGVDSDRLYPIRLQQEIADGLPHCDRLRVLESRDGHDGFLTEADAVAKLLVELMELADA